MRRAVVLRSMSSSAAANPWSRKKPSFHLIRENLAPSPSSVSGAVWGIFVLKRRLEAWAGPVILSSRIDTAF
jgi:hypothetical protein